MAYEIRMPQLAQSVVEGEITRWRVKEGDSVELDQLLADVTTDKVDVELPSPVAGTVLKISVPEGQTVPVGTLLLYIGHKGESLEAGVTKSTATYSALTADIMGLEGKKGDAAAKSAVSAVTPTQEGPVRAAPAVRKRAQELGVELAAVVGTGPGGRITTDDVERAAAQGAGPKPEALVEYVPYTGRRRQIGDHLFRAKQSIPHASCMEEIDVTDLVELYVKQKEMLSKRGIQLTYMTYFVRATVETLKNHPILNATLEEKEGRIAVKKYYNIGIAAAAKEGLIVPVLRDADRKGLVDTAAEIQALANKARENRLTPSDVQGSTFTISNVGGEAGLFSVGIINSPEVALLNIHRIEPRPAVVDRTIEIRQRVYVTLTFDHRVLDGREATNFLRDLKKQFGNVEEWAKL